MKSQKPATGNKRQKSIDLLNKAVAEELYAVHQYMYFHFRLDDAGYDLLANIFKRTAINEMTHVEMLAERILFLKGDVDMKVAHEVEKIHDVEKMVKKGVMMETATIDMYNEFAKESAANADSVTKKLFEDLLVVEEEHQDVYETEDDNLKNFGGNYLALQSIERSKQVSVGSMPSTE